MIRNEKKKMFPLYMFGSREGEGNGKEKKDENVYLLFVWFAKEENYVFFTLNLINWTRE